MRFLCKILLIVLIVSCSCLSKSKLKKFKQQLITVPEDLETYPEAILTELNQFLTLYQQPELQWSEPLKETAKKATEDILENDNFGQHSQLEKWQSQVPNDIFTEMCFNVNVTNSNYYSKALSQKTSFDQKVMYDTKLSVGTVMKTVSAPSAQMFAKNIIESLESEHLLLSLNQYSHCGISISPMDQAKYPNEYLAVMHLIKSASGATTTEPTEPVVIYTSCKDALAKGNKDPEITILVNGENKQVKCDQEKQNGGWTLIFSVNKDFTTDSTNTFDDFGLEYTEVFVQTKEDQYSEFQPTNWRSNGWNFAMNTLKFGNKWYATTETPYTRVSFDNYANKVKYPIHQQTTILDKSDKCYFKGVNHFGYCGYNFIFKRPGNDRITGISDVETITGDGNADNKFHYDLDIYVR